MIHTQDAEFHAIPPEHRELWTESHYFPFSIPERGLAGAVYCLFRPGLGVCMSDVTIFDRCAEHWEGLAYADNQQHIPCPPSLIAYSLRNGVRVEMLSPLERYRVAYQGIDDTALTLHFDAVMRPQDLNDPDQDPITRRAGAQAPGWDQAFAGHFDTTCRVTGTLRLRGVDHAVDCLATLDRSWGPRAERDAGSAVVFQASFGTDWSLHALAAVDPRRPDAIGPVLHGYVWRDGAVHGLIEGAGTVRRTGMFPDEVTVEVVEEGGRRHQLTGTMRNWAPWAPCPSVIYYAGLAAWECDGRAGYGPYQEILSRAFVSRHHLSK